MNDGAAPARQPCGSLRRRLVLACLLVQLIATAAVFIAGSRLLQGTLVEQAHAETRQVMDLLEQALATPLAQRDYATLQQTLDLVRGDAGIRYLVLADTRGTRLVSSGWDDGRALPPRDSGPPDLDRADATLHQRAPVRIGGQELGHLDFGLSTVRLRQTRDDFLQRSLLVGAAALAASMGALALIAYAVTRHLVQLAQATQRVAQGDLDVQVPVHTHDEIGQLACHFNAMAVSLKERVAALERSEAEQVRHLHAAREEQSRLTTLLGALPGGIVFVDGEGRLLYANAAFWALWSLEPLAAGEPLAGRLPLIAAQLLPQDAAGVDALAQAAGHATTGERELRTRDGRIVVQRLQAIAQGSLSGGCIWFHDDVTHERRTQRRARLALRDPLTGLLNRRGLEEAMARTLMQAEAHDRAVSLLFVDLDDFKEANDTGGHRLGDEILVAVARRLEALLREVDTVARLGGDEFAVLCPDLEPADAAALAGRLVQAVAELRFPGPQSQPLQVGCSIGVASFPLDARTGADLLACADAAMYVAKRSGKNNHASFGQETAAPAGSHEPAGPASGG